MSGVTVDNFSLSSPPSPWYGTSSDTWCSYKMGAPVRTSLGKPNGSSKFTWIDLSGRQRQQMLPRAAGCDFRSWKCKITAKFEEMDVARKNSEKASLPRSAAVDSGR